MRAIALNCDRSLSEYMNFSMNNAIKLDTLLDETKEKNYPCYYLHQYYKGKMRGEAASHQKHCEECCQWLFENDLPRFDHVLNKTLASKTMRGATLIKFAHSKSYKIPDEYFATNNELLEQITHSSKAYKVPQDFKVIPRLPGVYILGINNTSLIEIIYVGSSRCIRQRLISHPLRDEINELLVSGIDIRAYCLLFPLPTTEEAMRETEKFLIREFKPTLNVDW